MYVGGKRWGTDRRTGGGRGGEVFLHFLFLSLVLRLFNPVFPSSLPFNHSLPARLQMEMQVDRIKVLAQLIQSRRTGTPRTPRPLQLSQPNTGIADISAAPNLGLTPGSDAASDRAAGVGIQLGGTQPAPRAVPTGYLNGMNGANGTNGHGPAPATSSQAAGEDDLWAPIQKSLSSLVFWGESHRPLPF